MGKPVAKSSGYDEDYYAWANDQAHLLRNGLVHEADLDNIAEELEGLSRSERRGLQSSLRLIIIHMLKLQHQPFKATHSWRNTILRERVNVEEALADMPSLRPQLPDLFAKAYRDGRQLAIAETGMESSSFPEWQEFTIDQVFNPNFLPNAHVFENPLLVSSQPSHAWDTAASVGTRSTPLLERGDRDEAEP